MIMLREFFESLQEICTPSSTKNKLNFNVVIKALQTQQGCQDQSFHLDFPDPFSLYKFSSKLFILQIISFYILF